MEQDLLRLKGGLLSKADFIGSYGEEQYNKAIGVEAEATAPAPNEQPQEEAGFLETVGDGIVDIFQGIGRGMIGANVETAETVANANAVGTEQANSLYEKTINYRNQVLAKRDLPPMTPEEEAEFANRMGVMMAGGGIAVRDERVDFDTQDVVDSLGLTETLKLDTTAGTISEGISQFVTGFAMLGGGRTFLGAMLKGGVVDATAFDPFEGNLSNLIEEYPHLRNPITEVLATDPSDPEWVNRAKNALEGGIMGVALEGAVRLFKAVALTRKANTEIKELGKISDDTAAQLDEAHRDVVEHDQSQKGADNLKSRPDGMFEAPDGMVYKLNDDDSLTAINETRFSLFDEDLTPQGADGPSPLPQPSLRQQGEELGAQVADAIIPVKPKIEIIDTDAMQAALARSIEMGDFELRNIDEGGWFNLGKMDGPVEAAKIIDSMQEVLVGSRGAKAMGLANPETHDEVVKQSLKFLAKNTDTDVNNLIRDLGVTETVSRDMAARIVAGKVALQSTGRKINEYAKIFADADKNGGMTEKMDRQLIDLMQTHVELQANVKGLQTAAARATSAGRIITGDTLTGDSLDVLSAFGGSKRVRNLARELSKVTDDAQMSRTIKKAVDRKGMRVLNEYWINSILSGPTTHALNMSSNAINVLVRPLERGIGAALNGDVKQLKAAARTYKYLFHNLSDAIQLAAKSGYNMRPVLDQSVKVDNIIPNSNTRAISSEYLGFGGSAMDMAGKILTIPSRMLGTEDEFFKQLAYRSNLQARLVTDAAYMSMDEITAAGFKTRDEWVESNFDAAFTSKIDAEEAYQEAVMMGKLKEDDAVKAEFIAQSIGSSKVGNKYAEAALYDARQATFTDPLRKGTFSHSVQTMANKHPLLRQVIPFIQTPMNIMEQAFDRTPLLNRLRQQYRNDLASADPAIVAQAKGKTAMGAAIYGTLTMLAVEGRITGGGPTDPKRATIWRNSPNWQPYSINFGSQEKPYWVSYARMDPWTTAFGVVGDIVEMHEIGQMADSDTADLAAMTIAAIGNNVVSKTYLQGIADTVGLMDAKDRPWEVANFFKRRMASLMPLSSLTNQVGNLNDDYMREVRGFSDQLKKTNGLMRGDLPLKYDWVTGQPLETPDTLGGFFHITTKGLEERQSDAATIYTEMRKLGVRFDGARRKVQGVELSGEQYQRWNELMGTIKRGSKTLEQRLIDKIESSRYDKGGSDYNLVTASESHRVQILNREIKKYRDRAFNQLKREYPIIKEKIREYDRFKNDTRRGREAERPDVTLENLE